MSGKVIFRVYSVARASYKYAEPSLASWWLCMFAEAIFAFCVDVGEL